MAVKTGIDHSSYSREARKGFYWKPPLITATSGIQLTYSKIGTQEDFQADVHNVPWGSRPETKIEIGTSGYTGEIPVASGTLSVYEGIIVDYTVS